MQRAETRLSITLYRPLDRRPLPRHHFLGPFGQVLGAEELAADGPGEAVLAGVGTDPGHEEGEGAVRV